MHWSCSGCCGSHHVDAADNRSIHKRAQCVNHTLHYTTATHTSHSGGAKSFYSFTLQPAYKQALYSQRKEKKRNRCNQTTISVSFFLSLPHCLPLCVTSTHTHTLTVWCVQLRLFALSTHRWHFALWWQRSRSAALSSSKQKRVVNGVWKEKSASCQSSCANDRVCVWCVVCVWVSNSHNTQTWSLQYIVHPSAVQLRNRLDWREKKKSENIVHRHS